MTPDKKYDLVVGLLRELVTYLDTFGYGSKGKVLLQRCKYFLQFGELPPA